MKPRRFVPVALAFTSILSMVGCSDSSNNPTASIKVVPSLGLIRNAEAQLLDINGTEIPGSSQVIGTTGTVDLTYPANWNRPLLVQVSGRPGAEYYDEAAKAFLPFQEGRLRTYLESPQSEVAVTSLTELAATMLDSQLTIDSAQIRESMETIRQALAPSLSDITQPPLLVGNISDLQQAADEMPSRHAAVLAALAEMGYGQETPALTMIFQLRQDFLDGVMDGMFQGAPIEGLSYSIASFEEVFSQALAIALQGSTMTHQSFGTRNLDRMTSIQGQMPSQ